MNKENPVFFHPERREKCGKTLWIMWITWCITHFLRKNEENKMWMLFSWILWIKWISCESNMFFVQPDKFTIILHSQRLLLQADPDGFHKISGRKRKQKEANGKWEHGQEFSKP